VKSSGGDGGTEELRRWQRHGLRVLALIAPDALLVLLVVVLVVLPAGELASPIAPEVLACVLVGEERAIRLLATVGGSRLALLRAALEGRVPVTVPADHVDVRLALALRGHGFTGGSVAASVDGQALLRVHHAALIVNAVTAAVPEACKPVTVLRRLALLLGIDGRA